jgi:hypothetical protein
MKRSLLLLILIAAPATAAPVALDYRATDPSCIDGGRFSDEVSAKLGFVPWDPQAAARIRIRVERDGAQFTGTFRNTDGSAKVIDGKTCADVTASLVVTVATAVDTTPKVREAPSPPPPAPIQVANGLIPVTFQSVEGRRLNVSVQKASAIAVASNGTAIAAASFENLCTSPCTAGLPQGRSYLAFADPDASAYGDGAFVIDHPTTITLAHKSRHGSRMALALGGFALTGLSAFAMSQTGDSGSVVAGSVGLGLGLGALYLALRLHDTFNTTQSP